MDRNGVSGLDRMIFATGRDVRLDSLSKKSSGAVRRVRIAIYIVLHNPQEHKQRPLSHLSNNTGFVFFR